MLDNYPKFLRKAYYLALEHAYDYQLNFHHCSILTVNNNIIGVGFNNATPTRLTEHYANKCRKDRHFPVFQHSEIDVIQRYRNKVDLRGGKIYVIRRVFNTDIDIVGNSRPCILCQNCMKDHGISRAIYSISSCEYGVMNISKLDTDYSDRTIRE